MPWTCGRSFVPFLSTGHSLLRANTHPHDTHTPPPPPRYQICIHSRTCLNPTALPTSIHATAKRHTQGSRPGGGRRASTVQPIHTSSKNVSSLPESSSYLLTNLAHVYGLLRGGDLPNIGSCTRASHRQNHGQQKAILLVTLTLTRLARVGLLLNESTCANGARPQHKERTRK